MERDEIREGVQNENEIGNGKKSAIEASEKEKAKARETHERKQNKKFMRGTSVYTTTSKI